MANGGISRAARSGNLRRFSQISRVLVRPWFRLRLRRQAGQEEKKGLQEFLAPNFGVRLRRTLDDLGPTFVKFGQVSPHARTYSRRSTLRAREAPGHRYAHAGRGRPGDNRG